MKSLHVTETAYYVMPVRDGDTEETALQRFLDLDPADRDALCQDVREREVELK